MELDKNKFSMAAAGTMGIIYVVCALFVWLWPDFSVRLFGWLTHLVNLTVEVTPVGAVYGLLQVVVYTYVGAWIFAWLHNRFMKQGM